MYTIHSCSRSFFRLPSLSQVNTKLPIDHRDACHKTTNIRVRKVLKNVSVIEKRQNFSLADKRIRRAVSPIKTMAVPFVQDEEEDLKHLVNWL